MTKLRRRAGEPVHGFDPAALRRVRQERGLTLDALGDRVRATRSSLIAYEKGSRRPGLETLRALADALGVETLELTVPAVGRSLRDLRLRAGVTKSEVAARLGIGRPAWDSIERGRRPLQPAAAVALAEWLGVTMDEVIAARDRGLVAPAVPAARVAPVPVPAVAPADPAAGSAPLPPSRGVQPPADSFVGRERELDDLAGLIHRSRPLTLTGSSGVGKTRLALELIRKVGAGFPDGAWLVELAATRDPALVPQAVASVLGVREQPRVSLTDSIVARVENSRMLLLLDNCEHLVAAISELLERLLGASAGLTCVATSQQPLRMLGERLWVVPSLLTPDPGEAFERIGASEAVKLFCERASAGRRSFTLTAQSAPAVADICRRLDGIPLAIELAAARVGVLTPAEIASRLDNRFALLTGGSVAGRHQTLQAALEWSYNLLPPAERLLLRGLSVFVGGCSFEAVEAVCGGGLSGDAGVIDLLAALVAKSLVTADTSGVRARYRLPETVRLYAGDRADEAGEIAELRARHVGWCTALAEAAEPGLTGPDQLNWLEVVEAEHDNLREALARVLNNNDAEAALRLSGALTLFWRVRGYFREGRGWLESALALGGGAGTGVAAKALRGMGFLALMLDDTVAAIPALERSLSLDREGGDIRGQARSLLLLGNAQAMTDLTGSVPMFEQSVALARKAQDPWCLGHGLAMQAWVFFRQGDVDSARPLLDECVLGAREANELQSLRIGLHVLGNLELAIGDYPGAEAHLTEGLSVTRQLGEPFDGAAALHSLGEVAKGRGSYVRARELFYEALGFARQTGKPASIAIVLSALGSVALREGEIEAARRLFDESAAVAAGAGLPYYLPARQGLGEVAVVAGDMDRARGLFDEVVDLTGPCGDRLTMARALFALADLNRQCGDRRLALDQHHEALLLRTELGHAPGIAESLEAAGALASEGGRWVDAARLFGAAHSLRKAGGFARAPSQEESYEERHRATVGALGQAGFAAAWGQGVAMSRSDAVSCAGRARGGQVRPKQGWESLTRAERGIAALVAEGLTNAEIAGRLFVTRSTVEGHISHIFGKLGLESRAQLVRESVRREMATAG